MKYKIFSGFTMILVLLLLSLKAFSQQKYGKKDPAHYFYAALTYDANKAFGLYDNPRTVTDHRGFDWDLELGIRHENIGINTFYGNFPQARYQIYGAGIDYYGQWLRDFGVDLINPFNGKKIIKLFDGIDFSSGIYYSQVKRKDYNGVWVSGTVWVSPKAKIILWNGDFGLVIQVNYQGRPFIGKRIFEGSLGLIFKKDR